MTDTRADNPDAPDNDVQRERDKRILERGMADQYLSRREAYSACVAIAKCYPLLSRKRFKLHLQALICRITRVGDAIAYGCDTTRVEGKDGAIPPRAITYLKKRRAETVLDHLKHPYRLTACIGPEGDTGPLLISDIYDVLLTGYRRDRAYWRALDRKRQNEKAAALHRGQQEALGIVERK